MKKLSKLFLTGAIALGLVACNNEDVPDTTLEEGTTYMHLSIAFPTGAGTRALPDDYNKTGIYVGNDEIKHIDVYVVDGLSVEFSARYNASQYNVIDANNKLTPKEAIKVKPGTKTVYVVINDVAALRPAPLNDQAELDIANLAVWNSNKDEIMMTGYSTQAIEDGVTEEVAIAGTKNRVNVGVTRLASRAVVTTGLTGTEYTVGTPELGKLTNVTYSVAQGEKKIYAYAQGDDFKSLGYDFVPATDAAYQAAGGANAYYDYAGLNTNNPLDVVASAGAYSGVKGAFLFENTHKWADPTVAYTGDYRKGNTAYVLVRGTFTPNEAAIAGATKTLTGGTFYVGAADGKIYATTAEAQAAVVGQEYRTYAAGKVLYYAWLNPDNKPAATDVPWKPYNSPVVRNNVYHINITGFKTIGLNWNPLFPEDPDSPAPNNPDPKPSDPNEPDDTPIRPTDPLSVNDTWMSVEVEIVPWTVHLYDIELGL